MVTEVETKKKPPTALYSYPALLYSTTVAFCLNR